MSLMNTWMPNKGFRSYHWKRCHTKPQVWTDTKLVVMIVIMTISPLSNKHMLNNYAELDVNALSQSALRDVLMEDLIVDSSLIRVTTIIGQGMTNCDLISY